MLLAKQSTAKTVIVGPILDSTGAEYASAVIGDLSISKNGGTLTAMASAATLTYIANGMYTLVFTTGNLDTLGTAEVSCNKATYQMRQKELSVVPATVYDAIMTNAVNSTGGLTGATGTITGLSGVIATSTNITAATGITLAAVTHTGAVIPTVTTTATATAVTTVNGLAAGVITATSIAADAITDAKVAADVTIASVTGSVGSVAGAVASVTAVSTGAITSGSFASNAITAASINAAALNGKGDWNIGKTGYALTATTGLGNQTANITGTITTTTNLTNAPTSGDLTATMKTSVNAEVLDVLSTDTFAELGAVPSATSSLKDKLTYMFMWFRNKSTQTSTTRLLRNDADNATVATETVSDDGTTYTKGEAS
jgi:hypothetical protein